MDSILHPLLDRRDDLLAARAVVAERILRERGAQARQHAVVIATTARCQSLVGKPDMGRPAHEPDFAKRRQVEALAGYGVPEPDIAGVQHVGGLVNPTALVARVLGKISSIAFQKPSAPSPMARSGAISRPRRLMSTRSSRQLCALSTHECTGTARSAVQRARPICSTRCVWRSPLDLRLRNLLADARFAKEFPRGVDLVVRHHDPARQHAERAFDDAHVLVGNESVDAGFGGRSRAKNSACPLFYRREKSRESASMPFNYRYRGRAP